jgi:hypothetical protein
VGGGELARFREKRERRVYAELVGTGGPTETTMEPYPLDVGPTVDCELVNERSHGNSTLKTLPYEHL